MKRFIKSVQYFSSLSVHSAFSQVREISFGLRPEPWNTKAEVAASSQHPGEVVEFCPS